jgi:transcriptional regulator with XRE-family HTH domain
MADTTPNTPTADVAELRRQRGLTQQQLASAARVSPSHLRQIEQGYHPVRSDAMARIMNVLDAAEADS